MTLFGYRVHVELRQLRYFATVARELNFTRAAARLRVAQPALSRQIKQLEEEIGGPLFHRTHRQVLLTETGQRFFKEAEALLVQAETALAQARERRAPTLNVGYVWGLFHSTAPQALQRLRLATPELAVHLFDMTASQQGKALAEGRLQFGFIGMALEADAAALEKRRIGQCRFTVALPEDHRLAAKSTVALRDLKNDLFLLISGDHFPGASRVMLDACAEAGFRPRVLEAAERGHTLLGLVAAGCGIALLPDTLEALPHAGVCFRPCRQRIEADLFLAWRRGLEANLIEQFVAAVNA